MSAPAAASTVLTSSVRGRLVTGTEVAITARQHEFTIDEPQSLGCADKGANPIEHLLAARASCTVISYQVWADSRRPRERGRLPPPDAGCYACYMATISHRELRNDSAEVLRRVAAGESLTVTNRGEPVARMVPLGGSAFEEAVASGQVQPARAARDFSSIHRVEGVDTAEVLEDLRGDR